MNDWTTCRVVRGRDCKLWVRGCDSDDLCTANTNYPDVFLTTDEVLTVFGPLTPVLDADGRIYIGSQDRRLYSLLPGGTVNWVFVAPDKINSSATLTGDGTVYFGCDDGKLYSLR